MKALFLSLLALSSTAFAAGNAVGTVKPKIPFQSSAPAEKITDPARITPAYLQSFGDVKKWFNDDSYRSAAEIRCFGSQLNRMAIMKNKYLAGITDTTVNFLRKDAEALLFNLTAQQTPVADNPRQVRGFWITIHCADSTRSHPAWQELMDWIPVFDAITQSAEAQRGLAFQYVEITPQGGNLPMWKRAKTGEIVHVR